MTRDDNLTRRFTPDEVQTAREALAGSDPEPPIGAVLAEALGAERVEMTKATPGSDEALALGCTCAVMDNGHGRGRGDGSFWINGDCPLHGDDRSHPDRVDGRPQDEGQS